MISLNTSFDRFQLPATSTTRTTPLTQSGTAQMAAPQLLRASSAGLSANTQSATFSGAQVAEVIAGVVQGMMRAFGVSSAKGTQAVPTDKTIARNTTKDDPSMVQAKNIVSTVLESLGAMVDSLQKQVSGLTSSLGSIIKGGLGLSNIFSGVATGGASVLKLGSSALKSIF